MTCSRPRLRKGSRVAVVSPAGAAKPERIELGVERLRAFGYDPVLMPHAAARGPMYFAGTVEERLSDLHAAFADASIDGIVCTRGGWGAAELLPGLDRALVRAHPKVFAGYSDVTSLHTVLQQECGLMSFYAPMAAADWYRDDGVDEAGWLAVVQGESAEYAFGEQDGMRVLRAGTAQGTLRGGCLTILCQSLGTPWAFRVEEPSVLFVEDVNTAPYQWDRCLQHLKFAGALERVTGIVLGEMSANAPAEQWPMIEAACLHALRDFDGPIAIGLRCGHLQQKNRSLPLGARAELRCERAATLKVSME